MEHALGARGAGAAPPARQFRDQRRERQPLALRQLLALPEVEQADAAACAGVGLLCNRVGVQGSVSNGPMLLHRQGDELGSRCADAYPDQTARLPACPLGRRQRRTRLAEQALHYRAADRLLVVPFVRIPACSRGLSMQPLLGAHCCPFDSLHASEPHAPARPRNQTSAEQPPRTRGDMPPGRRARQEQVYLGLQ